ncbi:protein takeout-like [Phlebotomus argentipes]|uniref:protein takeout-like n=1 Tax=Phlebotomus argentipes TaxID=94469 RepID=UPI0028930E3D|nr:protein takeout-like [Phlebotomus argentipes]
MKAFLSLVLVVGLLKVKLIGGFKSFQLIKCDYGDMACAVELQQSIINQFWMGNEELELPVLDPLTIKNATLVQQGKGTISFTLQFKDFQFLGYRDTKITDVSGFPEDFDGTKAELMIKAPRFTLIGPYRIKGKLLLLDIQGSGTSNVTLDNIAGSMKLKLKKVIKDGEEYAEVEKLKLNVSTTRMYMNFDDLFSGNKQMNEYGHQFINENWQLVYEDIKPSAMKTFGQIWMDIFNHILSRIPYRTFFNV